MTNLIMAIATGFYLGYLPRMPGTYGSLLGLPLHFLFSFLSPENRLIAVGAVIILAVATAGAAEKIIDRKDPGVIVIDEAAGMLVALAGLETGWLVYGLGFVAFRFFDIWKPFPIRTVDIRVQGGIGIVLDDLIAGLYANLLLRLVLLLI